MKKLIILLLLISLTLGLLASCVPNDTSSGGEISGEASTNVEVTDEAIISEIKALLGKYNEYVLIVNMCEGSLEYDNMFEVLDFPILDWFDYDFTLPDEDRTAPIPRTHFYGRKITDSKYRYLNDLKNLLDGIYTKELSDIYYRSEFAYSYVEAEYGIKNTGFSNYPPYLNVGDMFYATMPFTDFAILSKRHINIDTIKVFECELGYIVTARGSSEFRDGVVCAPDSDVKFLFVEEENGLRISRMEAIRDHVIKTDSAVDDMEKLKLLFEQYGELFTSHKQCNKENVHKISFLSEFSLGTDSKLTASVYKSEHERIKNLSDIYDLSHLVFTTDLAELVYSDTFADGLFTSFDGYDPVFINTSEGLFVCSYYVNYEFPADLPPYALKKPIYEDMTFVETESGYVAYNKDTSSIFDIIYIDKVDMFGDGEYTFKISDVKSKYDLTDEEKALLGIN